MQTDNKKMVEAADQARIIEARKRKEQSPWYILRPVSGFMTAWDLITAFALIFTAIVTPVEVAFFDPPESATDGLFIFNRFIDFIFIFDMLMQFFIMYRTGEDEGSGTNWEFRLRFIACHYFKGWFALDMLSIIPSAFDILPLASPDDARCGTPCCRPATRANAHGSSFPGRSSPGSFSPATNVRTAAAVGSSSTVTAATVAASAIAASARSLAITLTQ